MPNSLKEEGDFIGSPSVLNSEFIEQINVDLYFACKGYFVTPYKPFIDVKRVLDTHGLNVPIEKYYKLFDEGNLVIPVSQFNSPEEIATHFLVFSYVMDEFGYEAYAEITDNEGLEEILKLEEND